MDVPEFRLDEYTRQQQIQNGGGTCEHCGSAIGHFNVCPLIRGGAINRITQQVLDNFYRPAQRTPELELTAEDERFLRDINEAFS